MKPWKRNVIIAGVLVLVCGGIYLNWLYGSKPKVDLTDTLDAAKILDDTTLRIADGTADSPDVLSAGAEVNVDYFAQVRLSRQTARDEAVNLLQETIAYAEGENTSASSAQLEGIIASALREAQIESLIVAKGYDECVAYITDEGISVAVKSPAEGLQEQDVAIITDAVLSQSDFTVDQIRVVGVSG